MTKGKYYLEWIKNPEAAHRYRKKPIRKKPIGKKKKLTADEKRVLATRAKYEKKNRSKILRRKKEWFQKNQVAERERKNKAARLERATARKNGWRLKLVWVKQ